MRQQPTQEPLIFGGSPIPESLQQTLRAIQALNQNTLKAVPEAAKPTVLTSTTDPLQAQQLQALQQISANTALQGHLLQSKGAQLQAANPLVQLAKQKASGDSAAQGQEQSPSSKQAASQLDPNVVNLVNLDAAISGAARLVTLVNLLDSYLTYNQDASNAQEAHQNHESSAGKAGGALAGSALAMILMSRFAPLFKRIDSLTAKVPGTKGKVLNVLTKGAATTATALGAAQAGSYGGQFLYNALNPMAPDAANQPAPENDLVGQALVGVSGVLAVLVPLIAYLKEKSWIKPVPSMPESGAKKPVGKKMGRLAKGAAVATGFLAVETLAGMMGQSIPGAENMGEIMALVVGLSTAITGIRSLVEKIRAKLPKSMPWSKSTPASETINKISTVSDSASTVSEKVQAAQKKTSNLSDKATSLQPTEHPKTLKKRRAQIQAAIQNRRTTQALNELEQHFLNFFQVLTKRFFRFRNEVLQALELHQDTNTSGKRSKRNRRQKPNKLKTLIQQSEKVEHLKATTQGNRAGRSSLNFMVSPPKNLSTSPQTTKVGVALSVLQPLLIQGVALFGGGMREQLGQVIQVCAQGMTGVKALMTDGMNAFGLASETGLLVFEALIPSLGNSLGRHLLPAFSRLGGAVLRLMSGLLPRLLMLFTPLLAPLMAFAAPVMAVVAGVTALVGIFYLLTEVFDISLASIANFFSGIVRLIGEGLSQAWDNLKSLLPSWLGGDDGDSASKADADSSPAKSKQKVQLKQVVDLNQALPKSMQSPKVGAQGVMANRAGVQASPMSTQPSLLQASAAKKPQQALASEGRNEVNIGNIVVQAGQSDPSLAPDLTQTIRSAIEQFFEDREVDARTEYAYV
jgi:hypothetical protein